MQKRRSSRAARFLVTGGAGFIGSHIVDELHRRSAAGRSSSSTTWSAAASATSPRPSTSGRVELVHGDIRDRALMRRLVAGSDTVFHQAALRITHCAAEPDEAMAGDGRRDLSSSSASASRRRSARWSWPPRPRSTAWPSASRPPRTHHPYDNRTLYGAAKSFGEGLLRSFNDMYGLDYVALRYFNVYGPRMDLHGRYTEVMVRWMERLEAGLPPIIFGDGLQTMDMVHVHDIARSQHPRRRSLGHRRGLQRRQRDRDLAPRPRPRAWPRHGPAGAGAGPRGRARGQSGAAPPRLRRRGRRATSGFRPTMPFDAGIRDLVAWWRAETAPAVLEARS